MNQNAIDEFMAARGDYLFPNSVYTREEVESALRVAPEEFAYSLGNIKFNNPTILLVVSIIGSSFGIDRFLLKKIPTGILKIITLGGFGIWTLVDVVTAKRRCRNYNCQLLIDAIGDPSKIGSGINLDMDIDTQRITNVAKAVAPQVENLGRSLKDLNNSFDVYPY